MVKKIKKFFKIYRKKYPGSLVLNFDISARVPNPNRSYNKEKDMMWMLQVLFSNRVKLTNARQLHYSDSGRIMKLSGFWWLYPTRGMACLHNHCNWCLLPQRDMSHIISIGMFIWNISRIDGNIPVGTCMLLDQKSKVGFAARLFHIRSILDQWNFFLDNDMSRVNVLDTHA